VALTTPVHGGDVEAVAREYGVRVEDLLDFSASINPLGPPASVMARLRRDASDAAALARYPDPTYAELRAALATHFNVPLECIAIANGSAALFGAVIRATQPQACLLPVPAFGEQQHALAAAGCTVMPFPLREADNFRLDTRALCRVIADLRPSLCVLTNPHNPSGALVTASELQSVVRAAAECHVRLLIDEAFIDFAPGETLTAEAAASAHLIVLRSLTKCYGIPALRVGLAVSTPETAASVGAQLPAWPVTTLAAGAAVAAVGDAEYARRTLCAVTDDRPHLREQLRLRGIESYESAANFLLLRLPARGPDSTALRTQLIRHHRIIVRDCRSFDGMSNGRFIRVAVRTRADNHRLVEALCPLLQENRVAD
jgi:threonine-phosphate decarboxylase